MDEEEFDEFEEATYNQTQSQPLQPSPSPHHSTQAVIDLQLLPSNNAAHPIDVPNSLFLPSANSSPPETHSTAKQEAIWPELGKTSSAHVHNQQSFNLDFSKSYSLTEPNTTPATQDFLGLDFGTHPQSSTLHFQQQTTTTIQQLQSPASLPAPSNDLFFDFTSPQTTFEPSGPISGSSIQGGVIEMNFLQNEGINSGSTNLYGGLEVKGGADFSLFTPMAENKPDLQKQSKIEQVQIGGLPSNDDYIFQFDSQQQTAQIHTSVPTTVPTEMKIQHQQTDWIGSYSAPPPAAHYRGFENTQPEIVEEDEHPVKMEINDRKQSEDFEFQEVKPAQPEPESRKESQQFVFQTTPQVPLQSHQPFSPHTETEEFQKATYQQQVLEDSFHPQEQQLSAYLQPKSEASLPGLLISDELQQPKEEAVYSKEEAQPVEEEDDQFGDFEETTNIQESVAQSSAANGSPPQDNTVRINQQYLNSQEGQFYRNRQKELQEFVDALPDYSFLFAKAFLP